MDTLILQETIIKYLQNDFVHKNVHVKAFPGYKISQSQLNRIIPDYTYLLKHSDLYSVNGVIDIYRNILGLILV